VLYTMLVGKYPFQVNVRAQPTVVSCLSLRLVDCAAANVGHSTYQGGCTCCSIVSEGGSMILGGGALSCRARPLNKVPCSVAVVLQGF
jgi:hypothetical protein